MEVLISTSFNNEERKEGAFVSVAGVATLLGVEEDAPALPRLAEDWPFDDALGLSITRRVLGRFSLRSGSCDGFSLGELEMDRDFRFRLAEPFSSISLAFSKASHAFFSSGVGSGVFGGFSLVLNNGRAACRKTSRAPWRLAILSRLCHR